MVTFVFWIPRSPLTIKKSNYTHREKSREQSPPYFFARHRKSLMVKDHYSNNYSSVLSSMYIISQWYNSSGKSFGSETCFRTHWKICWWRIWEDHWKDSEYSSVCIIPRSRCLQRPAQCRYFAILLEYGFVRRIFLRTWVDSSYVIFVISQIKILHPFSIQRLTLPILSVY